MLMRNNKVIMTSKIICKLSVAVYSHTKTKCNINMLKHCYLNIRGTLPL